MSELKTTKATAARMEEYSVIFAVKCPGCELEMDHYLMLTDYMYGEFMNLDFVRHCPRCKIEHAYSVPQHLHSELRK